MIWSVVTAQETRAFFRDRFQFFFVLLFIAIALYAGLQGAQYRENLAQSAETFEAAQNADAEAWRDRVVAIEAGDVAPEDDRWAGLAMDVVRPAVSRPGVLADFSHGVTDVHPYTARVSLWRSVDRLFGNYQFQDPNALRAGPVDLGFVVLFILPLLMIALSFGVLADDRDSGRLGLVMSQPIKLGQLIGTKLMFRFGWAYGLLVTVLLIGLLAGAQGVPDVTRLVRFGFWLIMATAYFLAWSGVIFWTISLNRRAEITALFLIGLWSLNSLVGPAILSATTQLVVPAPSQMAFLSSAREMSSAAYRERSDVMEGMLLDHPELNVDNYTIPEYIRTSFLVTQTVDRNVGPVLNEFDAVQAQRRSLLSVIQYLSPAAVAMQAMNYSAGSDLERQIRYERDVRDFKHAIASYVEPNVLSGDRLTVAEIDELPTFTFRETTTADVAQKVAVPILYFVLIALLGIWRAGSNLNRLQTRIRET